MPLIRERWAPLVDEITVSRRGSIHALKRGTAAKPGCSVMIAVHMDSVGLLVSGIEGPFLHVSAVGSLDPRVLPGTPVTAHGLRDLPGVLVHTGAAKPGGATTGSALAGILVDTGLGQAQLRRLVRIGDPISFSTDLVELAGGWISGRALDNRVSIAALTMCLDELAGTRQELDFWAVATTGEEVTISGAATSAFTLQPGVAVAVDTTFGKGPGSVGWETFELGSGPTLAIGPNIHPALHRRFAELAEQLEIAYAAEPVPAASDTDAMALQVSGAGVPTMLVEIPIRYMHTAVEVAAVDDIESAGRLLATFVSSVDAEFIDGLAWDGR